MSSDIVQCYQTSCDGVQHRQRKRALIHIGLDTGHDCLKAVAGQKRVLTPSSVVDYVDAPQDVDGDIKADIVKIGDRHMVVGLTPSKIPNYRPIYGREFLKSDHWLALTLHAVAQFDSPKVALCVGLPTADASDKKLVNSVVARLMKEHTVGDKTFEITHVAAIEQPVGSGQYWANTKAGKAAGDAVVCVLDIGGGTTDLAVIQGHNVFRGSGQGFNIAGHAVLDQTAIAVAAEVSLRNINRGRIEHAIRNGGMLNIIAGKPIDVRPFFQVAAKNVTEQISQWAARHLRDAVLDAVLLTGGGSILLKDMLTKMIDRHIVLEDAQFANALGFELIIKRALPVDRAAAVERAEAQKQIKQETAKA